MNIISTCSSLKVLKLAHNELLGKLDERIASLTGLELLDLSCNALTDLTLPLGNMVRLRVIDLSGNALVSLPFTAMAALPITDLIASRNRISRVLFPTEVEGLHSLQTLDVSDNMLTALTELPTLVLPELRQLILARNKIGSLPNIAGWDELEMLDASDNQLSCLPDGLPSLSKIKRIYLTGNNIKCLDERIGLMESLENLKIANNPLRPTKYLNMPTDDLKRELKSLLEPVAEEPSPTEVAEVDAPADGVTPPSQTEEQTEKWPVKPGGVLDRSSTGLQSVDLAVMKATAAGYDVQSVRFHQNSLTSIPLALSILAKTLTSLSLAQNKLEGQDYLVENLELPQLTTLNLSCNSITTLDPLTERLSAPLLSHLDLVANRISSLPILRQFFPRLEILIASDNRISELPVEAVDGLKVIDLRNNDIAHLPPKLGLLPGVERLDLAGNIFRVPRWTVLEKGTQATLAWLRDRIPVQEREEHGD